MVGGLGQLRAAEPHAVEHRQLRPSVARGRWVALRAVNCAALRCPSAKASVPPRLQHGGWTWMLPPTTSGRPAPRGRTQSCRCGVQDRGIPQLLSSLCRCPFPLLILPLCSQRQPTAWLPPPPPASRRTTRSSCFWPFISFISNHVGAESRRLLCAPPSALLQKNYSEQLARTQGELRADCPPGSLSCFREKHSAAFSVSRWAHAALYSAARPGRRAGALLVALHAAVGGAVSLGAQCDAAPAACPPCLLQSTD